MISLKKSLNKWIDIDDEVKFLIEYPTIKQGEHLEELRYDAFGKFIEIKESPDSFKIDLAKNLKYKRQFLKYVIKDWQGLEEKCILKNDEIEDELWWRLTRNENQVIALFDKIYPELEFDEIDKKKLKSVSTSKKKG